MAHVVRPFQRLGPACRFCARPLEKTGLICLNCQSENFPYDAVYCHYVFDESLRKVFWDVKFKRNFFYFRRILENLTVKKMWDCDTIVPVPLSPLRLWKRKFNQSFLIAQALQSVYSVPLKTDILRRKWSLSHQSALPLKKRRHYLKGKFFVKKSLENKTILLVDDLMTSGFTVKEASKVLKEKGAKAVYVWTLAKAL